MHGFVPGVHGQLFHMYNVVDANGLAYWLVKLADMSQKSERMHQVSAHFHVRVFHMLTSVLFKPLTLYGPDLFGNFLHAVWLLI